MKKNLKKVISAIAALALSTSSFVALAADFPDVPDTADYAKAVDQLTGMGIVQGDPDGTFQPDRAVTRAEMTAMIIRALGSENAANSMAGRDTVFSDVDHNHWAAGYVAVANTTNPMFIKGMGDGTFAPEATVTYAQAIAMLVRAVGYETWANPNGDGYPNGYLAQAGTLGITTGFAVVGNDTELNRGQVAILIDNAVVNAPILGEGDWVSNVLTGQGGYAPEVKDGTNPYNRNFWTTLATKLDVYQAYGRVTGTKQQGGTTEADEVMYTIMRSKNFNAMSYGFGNYNGTSTRERMNVGDTDAADHLNQYSEVLIKDTGDDDFVILSYTATEGRTQEDTFAATQFDGLGTNQIRFTNESGTNARNYKLDANANWFVNGYTISDNGTITESQKNTYLDNNFVGEVTLLDYQGANGENGSDGYYDDIMISYYLDAVVDEVSVNRNGETTINFIATDSSLTRANLTIDPEDEDRTVTFKGDAASADELEQYDVLSIQADPGVSLANSQSVVVTVSKQKATGQVTRSSHDDLTDSPLYYIGDGSYVMNPKMGNADLENSTEYTLSLDAFGYIAYAEEGINSKNYGIVDGMFTTDGGATYRVRMIESDGSVNTYDYYRQDRQQFEEDAAKYVYDGTVTLNGNNTLKNVMDRVVNYTITTSGAIRITGTPDSNDMAEAVNTTYQLNSNRVGSVRMNDNTAVLDLTDYVDPTGATVTGSTGDISVMGSFQADSLYTVAGYGRSANDSTYRFVIVLDGAGGIGIDSPLAVVKSSSSFDYGDGSTVALSVLAEGEEQDLVIDLDGNVDLNEAEKLATGDVFIYELGAENRIKDLMKVYTMNYSNYTDFVNGAFDTARKSGLTDVSGDKGTQFDDCLEDGVPTAATYETMPDFSKGRGEYAFFTFGPVLSTTGGVTIGTLANRDGAGEVSYMDVRSDYSYDADYNVYIYDCGYKYASQRVDLGSRSSIQKTTTNNSLLHNGGDDGQYIAWSDFLGNNGNYSQNDVAFALLKIDGGSITEGYTIIAPTD